jgi:hypothetical protein
LFFNALSDTKTFILSKSNSSDQACRIEAHYAARSALHTWIQNFSLLSLKPFSLSFNR